MKKKSLLLSLLAGISYLTLVSYASGPASQAGIRTGSPGAAGTCAAGGCHDAKPAETTVSIKLKDAGTGVEVADGKYAPLRTYDVTITVTNSSHTKFGFQAQALNSTNADAGVLQAGTGNKVSTTGGKKIIEHSATITGTTSTFKWISPAAGVGTVTFYAMGNAVNGNANSAGDAASNPYSVQFSENNTSVSTINKTIEIVTYPNPVHNELKIKMDNAAIGTYAITSYDTYGKKLSEEIAQVNSTNFESSINTYHWRPGVYYVQIMKDNMRYMSTIVKQ